jgi:hypothetical protein
MLIQKKKKSVILPGKKSDIMKFYEWICNGICLMKFEIFDDEFDDLYKFYIR